MRDSKNVSMRIKNPQWIHSPFFCVCIIFTPALCVCVLVFGHGCSMHCIEFIQCFRLYVTVRQMKFFHWSNTTYTLHGCVFMFSYEFIRLANFVFAFFLSFFLSLWKAPATKRKYYMCVHCEWIKKEGKCHCKKENVLCSIENYHTMDEILRLDRSFMYHLCTSVYIVLS